ncbi:efflux RND transporter permease subunit [Maribacter sp. 2304DJ31-5]|uniref:efflux RND transporter permease subunit n=1 Tax=Maribacter sp. 2304DJ31-5 TaxID=3386273 RepID=UPI0039BC553F
MVNFLIHRPIAVLMTALGVVILGLLAMGYVPISLMPDIDVPEITIQVDGGNMSARELEGAVVKPLRSHLVQLHGLEDVKSETSNGRALIKIKFVHGTPMGYAFVEVNEKVDRAMAGLPRDLERPRVIRASATDIPVFYLNLTLKDKEGIDSNGQITQEFLDFNRFANKVVRKRIEQIPEVAMVDISGLIHPQIIVVPDEHKLIALGLGLGDLESAIKKEDLEIGSILVKDSQYQYNLRLGSTLSNISDLGNIHIRKDDRIFQLKDLAVIKELPQKRKGAVLHNGKEAVTMAIIKQDGARMENLKKALDKSMGSMEKDYPEIDFSIVRDQTRLLDHAIVSLGQSLFWGTLLAFLIMFLFLRDVKSPLLIGIGIPISMVVCLLFFHLFHISVNIISLSGLILGIGLMIDNSIIVIDNIAQYREMGHTLPLACVKGVNEVFRPLLSSVLTTCAVFIPLIFLSGITGALFYDQAMAITIGLCVSLLVSITLLPVLYRLIHLKKGRLYRMGRSLEKWNRIDYGTRYEKGFRGVMKKQVMAFTVFGILALLSAVLFMILPKEQMPKLTNTETLATIDWNEPINVEEGKRRIVHMLGSMGDNLKEYNALVGQQQFLLDRNTNAQSSQSTLYLHAGMENGLEAIKRSLTNQLQKDYSMAIVNFENVDNLFTLIFSDDLAPLTAKIRSVENIGSSQNGRLEKLIHELQENLPHTSMQPIAWEDQIALSADPEKMIVYGVSKNLMDNALKSAFNEKEVLSLVENQDFVPVILGGREKTIQEVLQETTVKTNDSTYYNVNDFLTKAHTKDLRTITAGKEGEYYPVDFFINRRQEKEVVGITKSIVGQNRDYDVSFGGSLINNRKLVGELAVVLAITLLLLYFILASQFESLVLPFIILMEVPVAMAGAFFFLLIFGMGINLMSMIGIVVMSGIIINDSILKMDTILQLQRQGHSLLRALIVAGQRRLKPILMTSLTTILALVPVLLTGGLGGELQAPLAVALIGGMLIGTLVSLYFIPLCYYQLAKKKNYVV